MSTSITALMCHAPIVVPAVGGARGALCLTTTHAMASVASAIVARAPDVVVVLSPHTPRSAGFSAVVPASRLVASFAQFGAPRASIDLAHAADALAQLSAIEPLACVSVDGNLDARDGLDHGALVPLWFLAQAGWRGPTLVIGLPRRPTRADAERMGRALATASAAAKQRWAIVASGDMSHRLQPGAPAGFDADAPQFDASVMRAIADGDELALFDHPLRERAAEDVVDTLAIAHHASGTRAGRRTLSYEGPFGVGYGVVVLADARVDASVDATLTCVGVARDALHAHFTGAPRTDSTLEEKATGVFVTWRKPDGALRGCVGRMELDGALTDVLAEVAVLAATRDPRFPPVDAAEHRALSCEVTLLEPSEPIEGPAQLDAHKYGVEITSGRRRGVLLPAIDGIDDVATQLAAVMKKAGIREGEPYALRRFRARKVTA